MVVISEDVQDLLRSIYLHEIADGRVETPVYNECYSTLMKLDNPNYDFLRKPPRYSSWRRAGMLMTSVRGYDFGFYWNENERTVGVVEAFKRMDESVQSILSLMERIMNK